MKIRDFLTQKNRISRTDREWLLESLLRVGHSELLLRLDEELTGTNLRKLQSWLKKRSKGTPLQYITGMAPFRNLFLEVNASVLIPRPETEVLVDLALKIGDEFKRPVAVLDVGVGSGAIALAFKSERPEWEVAASDVSAKALMVAKKNAARLGCKLKFTRGHLLEKFSGEKFDLIVSNPPYIDPRKDKVAKDVDRFEPHLALYPEKKLKTKGLRERGAWAADRIIAAIASGEVICRYLLLELSPRVAAVLERRWRKHERIERIWREKDLAGRSRFLLIAWKAHGSI